MNKQQLFEQIKIKNPFFCVGLDTDIQKIRVSESKGNDAVLVSIKPSLMLLLIIA